MRPRGRIQADRRRGGQVKALGPAVDGHGDGLIGQGQQVIGQAPGLVAEEPRGGTPQRPVRLELVEFHPRAPGGGAAPAPPGRAAGGPGWASRAGGAGEKGSGGPPGPRPPRAPPLVAPASGASRMPSASPAACGPSARNDRARWRNERLASCRANLTRGERMLVISVPTITAPARPLARTPPAPSRAPEAPGGHCFHDRGGSVTIDALERPRS